jgi:hypothetical protein
MREFVRPGAFDAAMNLYTSFGYFEDPAEDRKVAENFYRSLKSGGALIVELMGKEVLARIFLPRDRRELPDGSLFLQERKVSDDWSWIANRWILVKDGQRKGFSVGHRLYDDAGLRALLLDVGFESVTLYGGWVEQTPYDTAALRLTAVARKTDS